MPARVLLFTLVLTTPLMAKAGDLVELLQTRKCPDCQLTDVDLVHSNLRDADLQGAQLQRANLGHARLDGADLKKSNLQFTNGFPLQWHTITAHTIGPAHNTLLPTTALIPTTHQARVVHRHQHRLDINQTSPSQAQCCELRQLTKSRQWHTTLPTALMLSTMSRLNHSLSETFKGATSSS